MDWHLCRFRYVLACVPPSSLSSPRFPISFPSSLPPPLLPPHPRTPSALFLLWAYLPEAWLHAWGITYYPYKEWALSLPAFLCMTYMMSGVVYVSLNLLSTAPLTSYETLTDRWTRRPPVYDDNDDVASGGKKERDGEGEEERRAIPPLRPPPPSVPHFADLDIGVVNRYLYGGGEKEKEGRR